MHFLTLAGISAATLRTLFLRHLPGFPLFRSRIEEGRSSQQIISGWTLISLIFILNLLLPGCTNISKHTGSENTPPQHIELPDNWTINGRISIINGEENWYAKFIWIQQGEDFQLSFTGPLGETELQVSQVAQHVSVRTPSEEHHGTDLEQLLRRETDLEFPINSLRHWLQGRSNPDMSSRLKYAADHSINDIFQDGWHIQYPKKMKVEQASKTETLLPKKIIAQKQMIKIKLIITRWLLSPDKLIDESSSL